MSKPNITYPPGSRVLAGNLDLPGTVVTVDEYREANPASQLEEIVSLTSFRQWNMEFVAIRLDEGGVSGFTTETTDVISDGLVDAADERFPVGSRVKILIDDNRPGTVVSIKSYLSEDGGKIRGDDLIVGKSAYRDPYSLNTWVAVHGDGETLAYCWLASELEPLDEDAEKTAEISDRFPVGSRIRTTTGSSREGTVVAASDQVFTTHTPNGGAYKGTDGRYYVAVRFDEGSMGYATGYFHEALEAIDADAPIKNLVDRLRADVDRLRFAGTITAQAEALAEIDKTVFDLTVATDG